MSQAISVTSWSKLGQIEGVFAAATPMVLTTARIISVTTRATPYKTTGVTDVLYELPIQQSRYQVNLIVTETRANVLIAMNANAVAT